MSQVTTVWGPEAELWLRAQSFFVNNLTNRETHWEDPPGTAGCFVSGTLVFVDSTAGLEQVPIESISSGMRVLARANTGEFGIRSDETVALPVTKGAFIYGFNGEKPFFTSNHVFFTTTGLRALNPLLAKDENPWLDVGVLSIGDTLLWTTDGKSYELRQIRTFERQCMSAAGVVYGLHFREGLRSYHANGYLVALNYPELTVQRLLASLAKLPLRERVKAEVDLIKSKSLLTKTIGPVAVRALETALRTPHDKRAQVTPAPIDHRFPHASQHGCPSEPQPASRHHVPITQVIQSYDLKKPAGAQPSAGPSTLTLAHGIVMVDGKHVPRASLTAVGQVRWTRQLTTGEWEHGALHLAPDRLCGWGSTMVTDNPDPESQGAALPAPSNLTAAPVSGLSDRARTVEAVKPTPAAVSAVATGTLYHTKVGNTLYTNETASKADAEPEAERNSNYLDLRLTIKVSSLLRGTVYLPEIDKVWGDSTAYVTNCIPTPNGLSITVTMKQSALSSDELAAALHPKQLFTYLTATFDFNYHHFHGHVCYYDAQARGSEGKIVALHGTSTSHSETLSAAHAAATPMLVSSPGAYPVRLHSSPALSTANLANNASDVNLTDLATMDVPDDAELHENAMTQIKNTMYYTMPEDRLKTFFGMQRPADLDVRLSVNLPGDVRDFTRDKFGTAFLSQGLSSDGPAMPKFTPRDLTNLHYYWNGKGASCLSQAPEYATLTKIAAAVAFAKAVPRLATYLASPKGEKWADELFEALVGDPDALSGLFVTVVSGGKNLVMKHCYVMEALAPTKDYPKKLWDAILKESLRYNTQQPIKLDGIDKDLTSEIGKELVRKVLDDSTDMDKDLRAQLKTEIKNLQVAAGISADAAAVAVADGVCDSMMASCNDMLNLLKNKVGNTVTRMRQSWAEWSKQNPLKTKLPAVVMLAVQWYQAISVLANWSSLKSEERSVAVLTVVNLGAATMRELGDIGRLWTDPSLPLREAAEKQEMAYHKVSQEIEMTDIGKVRPNRGSAYQQIGENLAKESRAATVTERWNRFYQFSERFARITQAAVLIATSVQMGYALSDDIAAKQPAGVLVMDVLQLVITSIEALAGVGELVAWGLSIECAIITTIGTCCAVAGIVLAIVSLFIHRNPPAPPESEAEKFMDPDNPGQVFISALKAPPAPILKHQLATSQKGFVYSFEADGHDALVFNSVSLQLHIGADDDSALFTSAPSVTLDGSLAANMKANFTGPDPQGNFTVVLVSRTGIPATLKATDKLVVNLVGSVQTKAGRTSVAITEDTGTLDENKKDNPMFQFVINKLALPFGQWVVINESTGN